MTVIGIICNSFRREKDNITKPTMNSIKSILTHQVGLKHVTKRVTYKCKGVRHKVQF